MGSRYLEVCSRGDGEALANEAAAAIAELHDRLARVADGDCGVRFEKSVQFKVSLSPNFGIGLIYFSCIGKCQLTRILFSFEF